MEFGAWVSNNAFELISALGIIGGLLFTAASFVSEAKTRRIANLLALTQNHRELWKVFYRDCDTTRLMEPSVDLQTAPITRAEQIYVTAVIHHLSSVYRAMKDDLTMKPEGIEEDVRRFFSLPIPKTVWDKIKRLQDRDFVGFVEDCLVRS